MISKERLQRHYLKKEMYAIEKASIIHIKIPNIVSFYYVISLCYLSINREA